MLKIIITYWARLFLEAARKMWEKLGFLGLLFGLGLAGIYAVYIGEQTFSVEGILVFAKVFLILTMIAWLVFIFGVAADKDKNKDEKITTLTDEFNSVVPNIQLGDEISVRDVWMIWTISTEETFPLSCMATAPFANNPKFPNRHNNVAQARAEITYLDENKTRLFKPITGRWGGLQPSEIIGSDKRILESTDFPNTGAVRWLDLLLKYPEDEYCYAYNNDSYSYARQFFQHPDYQISSKRFFIQVRLKGAHIPDDIWELEVTTKGKGDTFQIRKSTEEWQPKVKSQATKNLKKPTEKQKSSPKRTSSRRSKK